jgi:hypothetical protein
MKYNLMAGQYTLLGSTHYMNKPNDIILNEQMTFVASYNISHVLELVSLAKDRPEKQRL